MQNLHIHFEINPELYSKNPDSSELGKSIISKSIELINDIGFESFTFKKLGIIIDSPESSIYRYFKNKHSLLIYLTSWYWTWTEYRLVFATTNVPSAEERLKTSIAILTKPVLIDDDISYVNEVILSKIIFSESLKIYHTKNVDEENSKGYFMAYKNVVKRVSDNILEINQTYKNSHMLVSTIVEGAHQQKFYAQHLPSLTEVNQKENDITDFYTKLVFAVIK